MSIPAVTPELVQNWFDTIHLSRGRSGLGEVKRLVNIPSFGDPVDTGLGGAVLHHVNFSYA